MHLVPFPCLSLRYAFWLFFPLHFLLDLNFYCFLSIQFILWRTAVTCNSSAYYFRLFPFPLSLSVFVWVFLFPSFQIFFLTIFNLDQKLCTLSSSHSPSAISHTFTRALLVYVFGKGMYFSRWGESKMPWWLSWWKILTRTDQGLSFPPKKVSLKTPIIHISWWLAKNTYYSTMGYKWLPNSLSQAKAM